MKYDHLLCSNMFTHILKDNIIAASVNNGFNNE